MRPPTQKRLGNPSPSPQASGSNVRIDTQMVPVEKSQSPGHGSSGLQGVDPDDLVLKEMQAIWAATQNLGLAVYLFSINGIRNLALGLNITDMSLTAVKNLLEVDGTFKDLLVLCATKGRCDDLKRLREHVSTQRSLGERRNRVSHYVGNDSIEVTKKAWRTPYKGDAAIIFTQALHEMNTNRSRKLYDNFVSIIQSSGTGKSRMVDETAKVIFTLSFNLRSESDKSAYPEPDPDVRNFMLVSAQQVSSEALELRYLCFFNQLFKDVTRVIQGLPDQKSWADFALLWHTQMDTPGFRKKLYSGAIGELGTEKTPLLDMKEIVRESLRLLLQMIHRKSNNGIAAMDTGVEGISPNYVRLMLSVDEPHDFLSPLTLVVKNLSGKVTQDPRTPYQVLCRAFGTLVAQDIFAVFISTTSTLSDYSPDDEAFWSYRGLTGETNPADLQAPFVELPFDTFASVTEGVTLESVASGAQMAQFGRPLWHTRWQSAEQNKNREVQVDLFDFAIAKIFSLKDSKESGNLARDNGILSALSIRLLLEFEPRRDDARQKESALVAGHMRCCFLIPKHRRYLRSGTPSEPVLAEAAARIMNDTSYGSPVENLKRFLQNGLISKGERGEVVARLLLTLAHDQALPSGLPSASPRYSRPVPVLDFLKNLINLKYWDGVRQSRPANVIGGQTLEEAFKDARLNFTHFVKARDPKIISDEIAWMGLARGMAFVCAYGGEAIDLVIPILLWGEHLNRWVVSAIFFQFKNRASKRRVNIIDAAKLGFFTPPNHMTKPDDDATRYNTRPYITLVMNLGVVQHLGTSKGKERSQGKPGSSSVQTEPGPTRVQPQRRNMKREVQPKKGVRLKKGVHPRYAITITGCSNEVYGVIGSGTEASFAQMLCMYDLLDEHPRRDKKYQDAVLRMKPFWIYDPNSLHWTNHTMEREAPEAELETIHTGQEVEGPESDSDMEVEEG